MPRYHYLVRSFNSTQEIESGLRALSQEGWQPIHFSRLTPVGYEVILRREQLEQHAEAVLEHLEATTGEIDISPLSESG